MINFPFLSSHLPFVCPHLWQSMHDPWVKLTDLKFDLLHSRMPHFRMLLQWLRLWNSVLLHSQTSMATLVHVSLHRLLTKEFIPFRIQEVIFRLGHFGPVIQSELCLYYAIHGIVRVSPIMILCLLYSITIAVEGWIFLMIHLELLTTVCWGAVRKMR